MKGMEQIELVVTRRKVAKGAAKRLRRQGLVPGILYGHGFESVPLQVASLELSRTLAQAGSSQLIQLRIAAAVGDLAEQAVGDLAEQAVGDLAEQGAADDAPSQPVLAREIQRDVLTSEPIHVDFLAVSMTDKITAEVAITLVGEPEPVAQGIGILLQGINSIEIECLPGDLIPFLEVDVSDLDFDTAVYVSDLRVPTAVIILSDPQEMVAQVVHEELPEEVEEEELFEEEPAKVEVISRGRVAEGEG
jgi:large subunit ribosomal protein L25